MTEIKISPNDDGMRLERYIHQHFPQIPRPVRQKLFRTKKVAVFRDGVRQKCETNFLLQKNDVLKIFVDIASFGEAKQGTVANFDSVLKNPKFKNVKILFEDDDFFVVSKPAGLAVHPGSKVQFGHSLIDFFVAKARHKNPQTPEPKLVHRLDKDTSGLVLISRNDAFLRKLTKLIRDGDIQKTYLAVVKGKLSPKKGTIRMALDRQDGNKFAKIFVNEGGKDSITHFAEKKYLPEIDGTLVEIDLETGRMHQIRVHFASQKNPLAGDCLYGDFVWNRELDKKFQLKRQCLHAFQLQFVHPDTKKKLVFTCPLPEDFVRVLGENSV